MNKLLYFVWMLIYFVVLSCERRSNETIDNALRLADSVPDSVLFLLRNVNRDELNSEDYAKYSLAYYWAQDKSGLDVSNDSLIRNAYIYYDTHRFASESARAMYYMGKFYSLVDSIEKANVCLSNAITLASGFSDVETECLATYLFSRNSRFSNLSEAEGLAAHATKLYLSLNKIDTINLVYYMLNEAQLATYNKHFDKAKTIGDGALQIAYMKGDSTIISATHQAISFGYYYDKKIDSALMHIKIAYNYCINKDFSINLSLANNYLDADSLAQAKNILSQLEPRGKQSREYNKYYSLLRLSVKEGEKENALRYTDSTLNCIERMHINELSAKVNYYNNLVNEIEEKEVIKEQAFKKNLLWNIFIIFLFLLFAYTLHILNLRRKNAEIKLNAEKERSRLILECKEVQITTMRKYIEKKVTVLEKLSKIRDNPNKRTVISDDDWKEIEILLESTDAFVSRLKQTYNQLDDEDIRLLMLLRLGTSSKVMSAIYNIEENSIRHRLLVFKSKLGLGKSDVSIRSFICKF